MFQVRAGRTDFKETIIERAKNRKGARNSVSFVASPMATAYLPCVGVL